MSERFKKPEADDLKLYFDPNWIHYTASINPPRPSFSMFAATLEHQFFSPGTPKNNDFIILATGWLYESVWMTISIPTAQKAYAEAVAKYCSLKILDTFPVASKTFPMFATLGKEKFEELNQHGEWEAFPLHKGTNLFSLELADDHPIRTKKMTQVEWNKFEHDLVSKIVGEDEWTDEDKEEFQKFHDYLKS